MGMALGSVLGMSTEASMKLGGIAGIAAVAVNLLITHWDTLMGLMGLDKVKTEAEQMAVLEKNTARTADETARLNQYKKEQAAIETMLGGKPKVEKDTAEAVQHAFDEADPAKVKGALAAQMRPKMDQDQRKEMARANREAKDAISQRGPQSQEAAAAIKARDEVNRKIQEKLNEEGNAAAEKLMVRAKAPGKQGEFARTELKNRIDKSPEGFKGGLAYDLETASPAERKKQEALEAQGAINAKAIEKRQAEIAQQAESEAEGRKNAREYDKKQKDKTEHLATRYTGTMEGGAIGRELLKKPEMDQEALEERIKVAMVKAGVASEEIATTVPLIAKKLRKKLDEDVATRALDRGVSEEAARKVMSREAEEQAKKERIKDAGPKAEVGSLKAFTDKLLVAGLNKTDTTPKDHLEVAKEAKKTLDKIEAHLSKDKKGDVVARFAAGAARR